MRVLVTGGAGFIGSALVRALVRDGAEVLTIDRLTYAGNLENLAPVSNSLGHRFLQLNICDSATLGDAFKAFRPHHVMHLAAESHVDRSIDGPGEFVQSNVVGTTAMLETALRYWRSLDGETRERFRFLQVSTDEVYGDLGSGDAFDESSRYQPSSPYSASKAAADHLARAFQRTYGLPVLISNCGNNYGPYQFPEKLVPLMTLNALEGRALPVYGTGGNVRDWLYVDDHVAALRLIVQAGRVGETYLVGARNPLTNLEVVRRICGILDILLPNAACRPHEQLIEFVKDRPGHDVRYAIDPAKLERELGWHPRHGITMGLRKTVEWYLAHRDWCDRVTRTYDRSRLGLAGPPGQLPRSL